jgi:phenylalanyl-tRNA synthetase alpha subunit
MSEIKKTEEFYLQLISSSKNLDELEDIRIRSLGKKGEVSNLMKSIGSMNEEERKIKAPLLNALKDKVIENIEKKKFLINEDILNKRISTSIFSITLSLRALSKGAFIFLSSSFIEPIDFIRLETSPFLPKDLILISSSSSKFLDDDISCK